MSPVFLDFHSPSGIPQGPADVRLFMSSMFLSEPAHT